MRTEIQSLTLTPRQAADYIGVGRTKMLDLIRTKRIKVAMLDGRIRVSTEACRAFINSLPSEYQKGARLPAPKSKRTRKAVRQ